jgi:hypothetical protein
MIYVRWQAHELSVGRLGESPRVREPPHIVLNDQGQVYALGLEAEAAAAQSGFPLIRLTSFREVKREPSIAAKLLRYLAMLVWSEKPFAAALFPLLRPSMIVHFAQGAEADLSAEAAEPFIRELRVGGIRDVFLWVGEDLATYALRGAPLRGNWIGRAPRRVGLARRARQT